jgi:hypothetical protein
LTAPGSVSVTRDTTKGCGKSHDDI